MDAAPADPGGLKHTGMEGPTEASETTGWVCPGNPRPVPVPTPAVRAAQQQLLPAPHSRGCRGRQRIPPRPGLPALLFAFCFQQRFPSPAQPLAPHIQSW